MKLNFQGCNFFFFRISEKNFLKSQILSSLSFSSPNLQFSNERKPDVEAESFFTCFPEKSSASESSPLALCYECINLKKKTAEVEENYCSSCFLNAIEFNLLKAAECATAFQPFEWLVSLWHLIEVMMLLNFYYAVILIIFSLQNIEKRFR